MEAREGERKGRRNRGGRESGRVNGGREVGKAKIGRDGTNEREDGRGTTLTRQIWSECVHYVGFRWSKATILGKF